MKRSKLDRQQLLNETILRNPFITDEDLANQFQVSVQTIRLDRLELSIPELRERIRNVAQQQLDEVKALSIDDVIGEIVDLQLDKTAISILDIKSEHVFSRNNIARGHHLFAQANSLAVAIINDEMALTDKSELFFTRQVRVGERVIAKASVVKQQKERTIVKVKSYVDQELVFEGLFTMFRSNQAVRKGRQ